MELLNLRTTDGVSLTVPANLDSISTYVLLEQETWFEKELSFLRHWLRPGMTVLDIGANLGIYSIPMALRVGPTGCVIAYEPGQEARDLLARNAALNGVHHLSINSAAVSDVPRHGFLQSGRSSELNMLGDAVPGSIGTGEPVAVTSLDAEDAIGRWPSPPDFLKLDAEGEEERILDGGRHFFERYSPLVMFEVRAGEKSNDHLQSAFTAIGYGLYRMCDGAPLLVPVPSGQPLDPFEYNLFAAKPDRAADMARAGWLVERTMPWAPGEVELAEALALLNRQPFAATFARVFHDRVDLDPMLRAGLAAYAAWRSTGLAPAVRWAALEFALERLRTLCARSPNAGRLSTLARVAWEAGARRESVAALETLASRIRAEPAQFSEPFWPVSPRFDGTEPGDKPHVWFAVSVAEQYERLWQGSSLFSGLSLMLTDWLREQPACGSEMLRRYVLLAARSGLKPRVPARLCSPADDHLNAEVWRSGRVPGTIVEP